MNATDVECPVCGAAAGQRCKTMTNKALPVTHAKRKYAAFAAESSTENSSETATSTTGKSD
jgi:hypothetical protein